jgi:hypothetical protein
MKTENSLLERIEATGRGALVAKARLARRRTRIVIMPSLMEMELSYRRFRVKGSIYTRCEAVTVS